MNIPFYIAEHVLQVSKGDNWTEVNLHDTLKDVNYKDAGTQTQISVNTIASLVHHLAYWNRIMVQRIAGIKIEIPVVNGFDVPVLAGDHEWQALLNDYQSSAQELALAIKGIDMKRLEQPILPGYSSVYKNIQGAVEHIHYHLGQIVMLKKAIK